MQPNWGGNAKCPTQDQVPPNGTGGTILSGNVPVMKSRTPLLISMIAAAGAATIAATSGTSEYGQEYRLGFSTGGAQSDRAEATDRTESREGAAALCTTTR